MHGGTAARGVCKPVHIGGRAAVYTRKMLERYSLETKDEPGLKFGGEEEQQSQQRN